MDFKEKIKAEERSLATSIYNMEEFLKKEDEKPFLTGTERELLLEQKVFMEGYQEVLQKRIIYYESN